MTDNYYLKIGGIEVLSRELIANLSSPDSETKKKAEGDLNEKLKETRVRVGTLLKTDNVSFLIGAGASIKAGGIGLASIPLEIENALHEKSLANTNMEDTDWLSLFYKTISLLSGQEFDPTERYRRLRSGNADVPKIPCNLEDYLSWLHVWLAGMGEFAVSMSLSLNGTSFTVSKDHVNSLIREISP